MTTTVRTSPDLGTDPPTHTLAQTIFQTLPDAIVAADVTGRITIWNPAAERLFGYRAADVVGSHRSVLFPDERAPDEAVLFDQVIHGTPVRRYETQRRRNDRRVVTVVSTLMPLTSESGAIVGMTQVDHDVGVAGRADTIRRHLLEAVPVAILGVSGAGEIRFANGEAERLFGYRREELLGRPVDLLIPARLRQAQREQARAYLTCPRAYRTGDGPRLCGRRKDGSEFSAAVALSTVDVGTDRLVAAAVQEIAEGTPPESTSGLEDLTRSDTAEIREIASRVIEIKHQLDTQVQAGDSQR